jgi:GNAT superfamily N-acetyltransferase
LSTDRDAPLVQQLEDDDWAQLRLVRLAALADSPTSFASTLEREQQLVEEDWRARARGGTTFLALRMRAPVGIVAGIEGASADERTVVAMWVHPDHRRAGVASALLDAVQSWARGDGANRLTLWVTRTNDAAATLYRRAGFTATGNSKPLPSNPSLTEDELALDLR